MPSLSADDRAHLDAVVRAELEGDPRSALEHYRKINALPGDTVHADVLTQLIDLEADLPTWVRARWLVHQTTRRWRPGADGVLEEALEAAGAVLERECARGSRMPTDGPDLVVRLTAHNWVFRQRWCFELGGLAATIRAASPSFLARCGPVDEWVDTTLGGYRLVETRGAVSILEDLADGERVEILDPGSCSELDVGDHGIARLVPIDVAPGMMAESRLLLADELTAGAVAEDPSRWMDLLVDEAAHRWLRDLSDWHPGSLVSDIPELAWRAILLPEPEGTRSDAEWETAWETGWEAGTGWDRDALDAALEHLSAGPQTRVDDAVELVRGTLASWRFLGRARASSSCFAAAALLSPGAAAEIERALTAPRWEHAWRGLAAVVPEPAHSLCLRMADACGRVARGEAS